MSEAEETQRRVELRLKDMLYIVEGYVPRLNWYSFWPRGMENTRIIVPVSLAVASIVPSLLRHMQHKGERWASITLTAFSVRVSNTKTSPDVGTMYVDCGGACDGRLASESSRGLGSGYAMKQFSEDGDKAQIAEGFGEVGIVYKRLILLMS